jgi:hypothetical protein
MNWRRGLFRVWVLFTVLWCGYVGLVAYSSWNDASRGIDWWFYLPIAIGVPALVFVLGWLGFWIEKGFRDK